MFSYFAFFSVAFAHRKLHWNWSIHLKSIIVFVCVVNCSVSSRSLSLQRKQIAIDLNITKWIDFIRIVRTRNNTKTTILFLCAFFSPVVRLSVTFNFTGNYLLWWRSNDDNSQPRNGEKYRFHVFVSLGQTETYRLTFVKLSATTTNELKRKRKREQNIED